MSERLKIFLGYITISLVWGSTWLAIRIGLGSMTPLISAGSRFMVSAFVVFAVMKMRGIKLQRDPLAIKLYIMLSLFAFVFPYGLVYWAEQYIASGLASIVFASMPFFVIIFSRLLYRSEGITFNQVAGVAVGFAGIVIIFAENLSFNFTQDFAGVAAVLMSAGMQGGIAVIMKKYGSHLNIVSLNLVPLFIAGIMMTGSAFILENTGSWVIDSAAVFSVLYLAVFGTVLAFITYYWLLKKINVVLLSLNTFLTPILAVLLGWIILGEKLSTRILAGSALVLIGILFTNLRGIKNYYKSRYLKATL